MLLCLGEIVWDRLWVVDRLPQDGRSARVMSDGGTPGGCALNTACVLRGLGAEVLMAGNALGKDAAGLAIHEYLERHGITHDLFMKEGLATPFCQVMVERESGHRLFVLDHRDVLELEHLGLEKGLNDLIARTHRGEFSHAFVQPYLEDYGLRFLESVQDVRDFWVLIQDVEPDSPFIPLSDAVQVSLPEGESWSVETVDALAHLYLQGRARHVFVTGGANGVAICEPGKRPRLLPAVTPERVVDTTGCGDAFRAGLMWGLRRGKSLEQAVELGQRAGAYKAGVYGSHFFARL